MYVKLFNRILDSSLADNRKLRHFFVDLLLCSDADGNVIMTKDAIARRIRAEISEVEWGLDELLKPEADSLNPDHEGRRILPLDGHGYGWKILNFEFYRDMKNAQQLREASAERVRRHRAKKKQIVLEGKDAEAFEAASGKSWQKRRKVVEDAGAKEGAQEAIKEGLEQAGPKPDNSSAPQALTGSGLKVTRAFE